MNIKVVDVVGSLIIATVDSLFLRYVAVAQTAQAVFLCHVAFLVAYKCLEHVATERTELLNIVGRKGTVTIGNLLVDVACHTVQTVIVRPVRIYRCGDVGVIVQCSGNTHHITTSAHCIGNNAAFVFSVRVTETVTNPGVDFALVNTLTN